MPSITGQYRKSYPGNSVAWVTGETSPDGKDMNKEAELSILLEAITRQQLVKTN
jgi:hypothetical protein